jgi:hypothetical protein
VINSFSGCVTSDGFVRSFGERHASPSRKMLSVEIATS